MVHKNDIIIKSKENFSITSKAIFIFTNIYTGKKRISYYENVVVNVAKAMIADRLAGTGNDCNITYGAVGTGAGVPAATDTTLFTELERKTVTSIASSSNQTLVTVFFGSAEGNGVLTEFGLFGEAAGAAPDSGTMFNHYTISETKTTSETLTIDVTITIS